MFVSFGVMLAMADFPFGLQLGSFISYTAFFFLATFSAQRGQQPYFFECPIVIGVMPRLILRNIIFLVIFGILETIALLLRRHMPASWVVAKGKDGSPFAICLCVFCIGLAGVQIFTNRSLLERAHLEKRKNRSAHNSFSGGCRNLYSLKPPFEASNALACYS